jgi:YebC/PmpR family DNA-binding regulatory protein
LAGHSKWANIKHRKGAQDKKRAKIFTRILKEITVAARDGGPDLDSNSALRVCVQNAKGVNIPKDTIERAINKGAGSEAENLQALTYEGYGPFGIAVYLECLTDNINRTVANIRSIFSKSGGSLSTNGSLSFIFDQKGVFTINQSAIETKKMADIELQLIDGGAEEIEKTDEGYLIYTAFEDFGNMQKTLDDLEIEVQLSELQRIPTSTVSIDLESAKKIINMIDKFEEDDDINTLFHNMELTDELAEELNK